MAEENTEFEQWYEDAQHDDSLYQVYIFGEKQRAKRSKPKRTFREFAKVWFEKCM